MEYPCPLGMVWFWTLAGTLYGRFEKAHIADVDKPNPGDLRVNTPVRLGPGICRKLRGAGTKAATRPPYSQALGGYMGSEIE
jgi:hypothetical protein